MRDFLRYAPKRQKCLIFSIFVKSRLIVVIETNMIRCTSIEKDFNLQDKFPLPIRFLSKNKKIRR